MDWERGAGPQSGRGEPSVGWPGHFGAVRDGWLLVNDSRKKKGGYEAQGVTLRVSWGQDTEVT